MSSRIAIIGAVVAMSAVACGNADPAPSPPPASETPAPPGEGERTQTAGTDPACGSRDFGCGSQTCRSASEYCSYVGATASKEGECLPVRGPGTCEPCTSQIDLEALRGDPSCEPEIEPSFRDDPPECVVRCKEK